MNNPLSTIKNAIICGPDTIMWAAIAIQWVVESTHYILMKNWMGMGIGMAIVFWSLGRTLELGQDMLSCLVFLREAGNLRAPEEQTIVVFGGLKIDRLMGVAFMVIGSFLVFSPPVAPHYTIGGTVVFIAGALMLYSGTHEIAV